MPLPLRSAGAALACALLASAAAPSARAANALKTFVLSASALKWNQPVKPQRIFGDTYYVGVAGLSSILIHGKDGMILVDGGLPQSAPLIEANIRALGFDVKDIKLILNSHAHFDHAGGIAQLQNDSGAPAATSPLGAKALHFGRVAPDDPQAAFADTAEFPAIENVRLVGNGETLRVGALAVTAHWTPGHTPGSTSWTWTSCEGERCLSIVYADSLTAVAAPGFRYTGDATHADRSEHFRHSIRTIGALPCDVLITTHPDAADIPQKLKRLAAGASPNPFIDPDACKNLAREAEANLDARIAQEKSTEPATAKTP
jgi:metallo-beta-lactamase class B